MITTKRVYAAPSIDDGYRVLVDRLWPRGLTREKAALDAWLKEIAPSPGLRRWFGHEPARWAEFQARYRAELGAPGAQALLADLQERAARGNVTLLYATKSETQNSALVVRDILLEQAAGTRAAGRRRRDRDASKK